MLLIAAAVCCALLLGAAYVVAVHKDDSVAAMYVRANPGRDGAVCWPGAPPPEALQGLALMDAIIQCWPSSILAIPELAKLPPLRRQVKFALHEAIVCKVFGQTSPEQRFKAALLLLSYAEWNPDLHEAVVANMHVPDDAADQYAATQWLLFKDELPRLDTRADALATVAMERWQG